MLVLTKTERRALLIIAAVLLISVVIQWARPHKVNTEIYDYSMQDSLFKALSADTNNIETSLDKTEKPLKQIEQKKKTKSVLKEKSINVNTATQKELERLPRIGPATAKLIIEYREQNGPFKSIEELDNVKRIGPKTIEKIAPFITVEIDSNYFSDR